MTMDASKNLDQRAALFKALGHPTRLLILNLIRLKPRHGEELAAILKLKPATISHHLSKLSAIGLLDSKKDQYYVTFSLANGALDKSLSELVTVPQLGLAKNTEQDAYTRKVLSTFIKHGRLVQFPAQFKKRLVILRHIAQEFEPERKYSELEINQILVDFNEDVASLRRGMIEMGLMARAKGEYWRIEELNA
jgi:DNA-binding HxlR family transcriptional regulator